MITKSNQWIIWIILNYLLCLFCLILKFNIVWYAMYQEVLCVAKKITLHSCSHFPPVGFQFCDFKQMLEIYNHYCTCLICM
jgi:hypothetical protein